MTVTEEELQRIVAQAVKVALTEVKGIEDHSEEQSSETHKEEVAVQKPSVCFTALSKKELDEAMRLMQSNRGKDMEPRVGIFWYSPQRNDLFGVRSQRVSDQTSPNSRREFGSITISDMHEDVWKKEYRHQKYKNGGIGPFIGAYEMVPRGRIFYNPETKVFTIAVGSWIEQYPQAVALIVDEFNLGNTEYAVKTAQHWDIGQKWD